MNKKTILEIMKKADIENGEGFNLENDVEVEELFNFVVDELELPFNYYTRSDGGDFWSQIEYYSDKLNVCIIWNYDAGTYNDYDEMADAIISLDKELKEFESKVSIKN